jgi:hypothetical protein
VLESEGGDTLLAAWRANTAEPEFRRIMEKRSHPRRKFGFARHDIVSGHIFAADSRLPKKFLSD